MQVKIPFLMSITINNQLDLNLVDTCLGSTLQHKCRLLNTLTDSEINYLKIPKIWLVDFECLTSKIVYLA